MRIQSKWLEDLQKDNYETYTEPLQEEAVGKLEDLHKFALLNEQKGN